MHGSIGRRLEKGRYERKLETAAVPVEVRGRIVTAEEIRVKSDRC